MFSSTHSAYVCGCVMLAMCGVNQICGCYQKGWSATGGADIEHSMRETSTVGRGHQVSAHQMRATAGVHRASADRPKF